MIKIEKLTHIGYDGKLEIIQFEFVFDNVSYLPHKVYTIGQVNYIIADGSTATNIINGSVYTYNNYNWYKIQSTGESVNPTDTNITDNGNYAVINNDVRGYETTTINVNNSYSESDEGKVVHNNSLVEQTSTTVTENGVVDTTFINSVDVNLPQLVNSGINFYDYDGTLLYSYTKNEINNLTKLPPNPSHPNLTAQGWTYTLDQIKSYTNELNSGLQIGQIYTSSNNKTILYISVVQAKMYLSSNPIDIGTAAFYLGLTGNSIGTNVTINWNGTTENVTLNDSTVYIPHTFNNLPYSPGLYDLTITITVNSGSITLGGSNDYKSNILRASNTPNNYKDIAYRAMLTKIYIGNDVTLDNYAFAGCTSLQTVVLPNNIIDIPVSCFSGCCGLRAIVFPNTVKKIKSSAFGSCVNLKTICFSPNINEIESYGFADNESLEIVTVPYVLTVLGDGAFMQCFSLQSITGYQFYSIGNNVFYNCPSLKICNVMLLTSGSSRIGTGTFYDNKSLRYINLPDDSDFITIPQTMLYRCQSLNYLIIPRFIKTIESGAIQGCTALSALIFIPVTPPTMTSGSWYNLPVDCKIYVPNNYLSAYTSASNYPDPSTYTYIGY